MNHTHHDDMLLATLEQIIAELHKPETHDATERAAEATPPAPVSLEEMNAQAAAEARYTCEALVNMRRLGITTETPF